MPYSMMASQEQNVGQDVVHLPLLRNAYVQGRVCTGICTNDGPRAQTTGLAGQSRKASGTRVSCRPCATRGRWNRSWAAGMRRRPSERSQHTACSSVTYL